MSRHERLSLSEVFGLAPLRERLAETVLMLRGDDTTPPSKFDLTSLSQLTRLPGYRVWAGQRIRGRSVPIVNLYNYLQPPPEQGWSVRVTRVRDFRGKGLTYDSHNGTDFVTPVGTEVVAPAPGRVLRVSSEFDRGGLKVFIDHGGGLLTGCNHLARSAVRAGDTVHRGQLIALSGYSGIDGFATFPFGVPHVHFNVWLDGEYVDPFAAEGEVPLFVDGNQPAPFRGTESEAHAEDVPASDWDLDAVARAVDACIPSRSRDDLMRRDDPLERAMSVHMHMRYYPTRFRERPPLFSRAHARTPRLTLPFRPEDYDGIWFPDE